MSHLTSAQIITDSITPYGPTTRLTSIYVVFPKMILGERNRHRGFSLSDRSSRAVPPEKLIQEVRNDPAMPAKFRRRTKGMGGGEELTGEELSKAKDTWVISADEACISAEDLLKHDLAKEIINRPLDPYIRMHSLMTATRDVWLNFFGLRLDSGADPTIQVLAQKCFEAYKQSTPQTLHPGQWHLPFINENDWAILNEGKPIPECGPGFVINHPALRLSAARCAHLSYNDLETGQRMTIDRALTIYDKLVGSQPIHASPLEHQATPDKWYGYKNIYDHVNGRGFWENPHQHGNLHGWRQFRKMIPNEAVAPLPDGYEL